MDKNRRMRLAHALEHLAHATERIAQALRRLLSLRRGELAPVLLSGACFFCVLTALMLRQYTALDTNLTRITGSFAGVEGLLNSLNNQRG